MLLDWKNLVLIIALLANLVLGFFSYFKSRRGNVNLVWSVVIGTVILWVVVMIFYRSADALSSVFWSQILYAVATLIPLSFFYFTLIYPQGEWQVSKKSFFLIALPALIIIFLVSLPGAVIKDVGIRPGQEKEILWGPFYGLYGLYISVYFTLALWNLFRKYRKSQGILKSQIRYMLLGTTISIALGSFSNLLLPTFGEFRLNWLGQITTLFMIGFISYAIMRYQLMDIRFVIGKTAVYLFSFTTIIGLALLIISFNNRLGNPLRFDLLGPLTILLSIIIFQPIYRFLEKLASKYFYYTFYSYQTVLTDLGRKLTQVLDLDNLAALITNTLIETMKLDKAVLLLRNAQTGNYQIKKNVGFREENGISLVKDNFLTAYLEKTKISLVYEELSLVISDNKEKEKIDLESLQQNMKKIEASLCLPLLIEDKIMGLIVLGKKISGGAYSKQDLDLLSTLANQASIALQNARLYAQVKNLSENLQQKVNDQTKELQEAYDDLKRLDEAKSEFISIASHQLRTPLSAIKGYISMLLEGTYGQLENKEKAPLQNVYQANERLIKLVNDLLNLSRIEAGKVELEKGMISLEKLIAEAIQIMKIKAKEKGLYLRIEKQKKKLPELLLDKEKLGQAIINIVDNAIRYTEKGGVAISLKNEPAENKIIIEIKDTGAGMDQSELTELFASFSRGSAGNQYWTEGTGLGLYVAQKFVEMHGGRIWAESEGKNEGSTFFIELPIN